MGELASLFDCPLVQALAMKPFIDFTQSQGSCPHSAQYHANAITAAVLVQRHDRRCADYRKSTLDVLVLHIVASLSWALLSRDSNLSLYFDMLECYGIPVSTVFD